MGMFDYIHCSAPLPGTPPAFVKAGHLFQTKDTPEQYLVTYEITAAGRLFWDGVDQDYHGDIGFYAGNCVGHGPNGNGDTIAFTKDGEDAEWVEYRARFSAGQLAEIVETERTRERAQAEQIRREREEMAKQMVPPTPNEMNWQERQAESLVGRTVFVLWGGSPIENGYLVEVVAEDAKQFVVKGGRDGFQIIRRFQRDRTFFDSAADALASLEVDRQRRRIEDGLELTAAANGGAG